jgi:hypothetical protein
VAERERAEVEKRRRDYERRMANKSGIPTAPAQPSAPPVESKFPKSKIQRLAELLEKYRRDEITPAQYQIERAKILAEPAPTAGQ